MLTGIFLSSLLISFSIATIGFLLSTLIAKSEFFSTAGNAFKLFIRLILGSLFIISFSSIYYTGFNTIFLFPALLSLTFIFLNFKPGFWTIKELKKDLKYFLTFMFGIIAIIGLQLIRNDYFNTVKLFLSFNDYNLYQNIASYLPQSGHENIIPWYSTFDPALVEFSEPYHYGDLWLLFGIMKILPFSSFIIFFYIFIPFLVGFSGWGLICIAEKYDLSKKYFIFIFPFVLLTGVYFIHPNSPFGTSILINPKLAFFHIFLCAGLVFLIDKKYLLAAIMLCLIPYFHFVYTPVILISTFLLGSFLVFLKKERNATGLLILPLLSGAILFAFYFLNQMSTGPDTTLIFNIPQLINGIKLVFFRIVLKHPFFYLPIYVLLLYCIFRKTKLIIENLSLILLLFFLFIGGIGLFAISFKIEQSFQFFSSVNNPVWSILFTICFVFIIKNEKNKIWIFTLGLFAFLIVLNNILVVGKILNFHEWQYSKKFVHEIQTETKKMDMKIGLAVCSDTPGKDSDAPYWLSFTGFLNAAGKGFCTIKMNQSSISGNQPKIWDDKKYISPYSKCIENSNDSLAGLKFIRKFNIRYVVIENGALLPGILDTLIERRIKDPVSGHEFCTIKK